jgi:hypothetical protein
VSRPRLQFKQGERETRLNLFWLRYVSYVFLGGAVLFYFALRLNRLAISRTGKAVLYTTCIAMACVTWWAPERDAEQFSPRQLALGRVVWVSANHHKGGTIDDDFQLQLGAGVLSPKFKTDILADSDAEQPIHRGDLLGVLYRTWDNAPLTIDEVQGQRAGWHYRRYVTGGAYLLGVSICGLLGLVSALVASRKQRARPEAETKLHLND